MNGDLTATIARAFRRVALPLAAYYALTVGVPLANGAQLSATFVHHTLVVLMVPPIFVVLLCVVRWQTRLS